MYPTRNAEYMGEGIRGQRHGLGRLVMFARALPYVRKGLGGAVVDAEVRLSFVSFWISHCACQSAVVHQQVLR